MINQEYFYIPFVYENIVTQKIAEWTAMPNNGWTIITGVYAPANSLITGFSTVENVLRLNRERQAIALGFENTFTVNNSQSQFMQLIGFTVYGDFDKYAPAFKAEIMQLEGVVAKNNSEDYLLFLNEIINGTNS